MDSPMLNYGDMPQEQEEHEMVSSTAILMQILQTLNRMEGRLAPAPAPEPTPAALPDGDLFSMF